MATSYARSISWTVALWAAIAISAAQEVTSRPAFLKREVLSDSDKRQILNSQFKGFALTLDSELSATLLKPTQYDGTIEANYVNIDAEKSLLIHDSTGDRAGLYDDKDLGFARVFTRAAAKMGMGNAAKASRSWYDSAAQTIPRFKGFLTSGGAAGWNGQTPESAPFELLAVVNRMDFASTECAVKDVACKAAKPMWRNAELHFAYGLVQDGHRANFTLIIEFVLPPLTWAEFRTLEGRWNHLGKLTGGSYLNGLKAVINDTPVSSVRLRTNSELGAGAPWFLAQWDFTSAGLKQTDLPDQIWAECANQGYTSPFPGVRECPKACPGSCNKFSQLWDDYAKTSAAHHLPVLYAELLPLTQCYVVGGPKPGGYFVGMDNAPGKCSDADGFARRVIALQQCSMCHGPETNNGPLNDDPGFTHIHPREPKATMAGLSRFLTGAILKPSFEQLNADASVNVAVFTAAVHFDKPGCYPPSQTIERRFHDLGRRSLFLAAVLVNDVDKPPDPVLTGVIEGYGPDFRH
jgi:hypothetical protein